MEDSVNRDSTNNRKRKRRPESGLADNGQLENSDEDDAYMDCIESDSQDELGIGITAEKLDTGTETDLIEDTSNIRLDGPTDILSKINEWWKKNMRKVCFRVEINGQDIGVEQHVELHMKDNDLLYPAASVGTHQRCIFNFGQEAFRYDQPLVFVLF